VPNFKQYFSSLNFAAKHFLIRDLSETNGISRHYTICNAMRPSVYRGYINALADENAENSKFVPFNPSLIDEDSSNQM
jgi:hypothetical protein